MSELQLNEYSQSVIKQGITYFDILLYNCYNDESKTVDKEKLNASIDDMLGVYEKLFDFSLTLSGYQFVGLFLQNNLGDFTPLYIKIAYFILSVGFLVSMFGALLCFITIEYLRGCRDEEPDFIIFGIKFYSPIFKLSDKIIYLNCILFLAPINLLIYNCLDPYFGIAFNGLSIILFIIGIIFHYFIIIRKQIYHIGTYNYVNGKKVDIFTNIIGNIYVNICDNPDYNIIKRKIY